MQRYSINTPLVAVRLFRSEETEKAGVMTSLPSDAVVEIHGPSDLGERPGRSILGSATVRRVPAGSGDAGESGTNRSGW
jgi:hypothetical protein